jgi:hypothetical protein
VSLSPAIKLSLVSLSPAINFSKINKSLKIRDKDSSLVSLTPAINFSPVSLTPLNSLSPNCYLFSTVPYIFYKIVFFNGHKNAQVESGSGWFRKIIWPSVSVHGIQDKGSVDPSPDPKEIFMDPQY